MRWEPVLCLCCLIVQLVPFEDVAKSVARELHAVKDVGTLQHTRCTFCGRAFLCACCALVLLTCTVMVVDTVVVVVVVVGCKPHIHVSVSVCECL